MIETGKKRVVLGRITFVFLGLVICVFAWGLQYKLSLYDPPQATSHHVPQAKLLSKDQWFTSRSDASTSDAGTPLWVLTRNLLVMPFALLLALAADSLLSRGKRQRDGAKPWLAWTSASLNAFFFRPPPAVA